MAESPTQIETLDNSGKSIKMTLSKKGSKTPKWLIISIVIVLIAAALLTIFGKDLTKYLPESLRFPSNLPKTGDKENIATYSAQPFKTQTGPTTLIADCKITKDSNPLVVAVSKLESEKIVVGGLFGNINEITGSGSNYKIDLLSPTATQRYTFDIKEESGLVRDSASKEIKLSSLKRGQTILVSFSCSSSLTGDQFKITDIAKTSK